MAALRSSQRRSRGRSRRRRIAQVRRSWKRSTATRAAAAAVQARAARFVQQLFILASEGAVRARGGGHAVLSISANDPDLLQGEPAELVSAVLQATARDMRPFREQISRNETNWAIVAAASAGWAEKIFPGLPPGEAVSRLWDAIARMCRLDAPDPLAAWETHLGNLAARSEYLNSKRYSALKYTGPGHESDAGAS